MFLGLAENEIFYADIDHFHILGHVPRSRGAAHFAVDWQKLRGQVGFGRELSAAHFAVDWQKLRGQVGFGRELRLCVTTKKKLQLYEWRKNSFSSIKVRGGGEREGGGVTFLQPNTV